MFNIEDYEYDLPEELIAQEPASSRDHSRLLVVERSEAAFFDRYFFDLPGILEPGDLMVVNNPNDKGAAIGGDTNVVTLLEPHKDGRKLPVLPKREVAQRILDWVVKRRTAPRRVKDG